MSKMIEQVAQAISRTCLDGCEVEGHIAACRPDLCSCRNAARAALAAMREPTFDPDQVSYHQGMTRADWWRAMIDRASAT